MGTVGETNLTEGRRRYCQAARSLALSALLVPLLSACAIGRAQQFTPVTRLQFDVNVRMPDDTDRIDQSTCQQGFFDQINKDLQSSLGGDSKLVDYGCYFITGNPDNILHAVTKNLQGAEWQLKGEFSPQKSRYNLVQIYRNGPKGLLANWTLGVEGNQHFTILFALLYEGPP